MARSLVAYFSATDTTRKVAEKVALVKGADLFEIVPETPYTEKDLDWTDANSRSSKEMENPSFRPAVKGRVENMNDYGVIYLGFPIWWYVAPTIINTFLEGYDLTGKTIVPFATSGGSGMGKTNEALAPSCKGAILKEGKRLSAKAGSSEIVSL